MSLHTIGDGYTHYVLPASFDSIPESWKSNKTAKPIASSMQTVNVPSLSGNQTLGGSSVIQIPCGAGAGIAMNAYVRFSVAFSSAAAVNSASWYFKGQVAAATACVNRISTYVNSVQVDNIQNAWAAYDCMLANSTANDWLAHDGTLMLGCGVSYNTAAAAANPTQNYTFAMPLLGLLGSQQAVPLYLINGTLQLQIDWQSAIASIYNIGAVNVDPAFTGMTVSNVQLVYDKIMPEQNFIEKVRHDMMQGAKYVYAYTNLSTVTLPNTFGAGAGTLNLNYGLNVSSLQGILATQYVTANLSAVAQANYAYSVANALSSFQVSLDGRLISSLQLSSITDPVLLFAEAQKVLGRLFDSSITSPLVNTAGTGLANGGFASGGNFLTQYFVVGASAQRVNEGLAFQGSPCSIMNIQVQLNGTTNGVASASSTMFFILLSAFQLLIDATGSVEIVR